jgi:hypothetical protein
MWMCLPVTLVGDAAPLGIWLPTLREGVSSYKEDLNSSRRGNHVPSKYRGASKRNLATTYYNLSVDVYFTMMNEFIRRRINLI